MANGMTPAERAAWERQVREALEGLAPQYNTLWQPWLGPFVGADHSLIFPGRSDLASCALLPLRRGGELIGCLNFGSRDRVRFTRHHGVDFLRQLGDIAAVPWTRVLEALSRELGLVGMIRFMQQFEMGQGDYSKDRHQWLDKYTVDDIAKMMREKKGAYKTTKKKK